jgi:hypothetical protein
VVASALSAAWRRPSSRPLRKPRPLWRRRAAHRLGWRGPWWQLIAARAHPGELAHPQACTRPALILSRCCTPSRVQDEVRVGRTGGRGSAGRCRAPRDGLGRRQ